MTWLLQHFVQWLEEAAVWIINQFIISIGALISTITGLLPNMPDFPTIPMPSGMREWYDYGNYWFPFDYFITLVGIIIALWIAWMIAAIPFRWARAVKGNQ